MNKATRAPTPPAIRFARFVSEPDERGCILWTGLKTDRGYGRFWDGSRTVRAHQFSFILYYGPVPAGMGVLHRCDVRHCVNPQHLFLGTQADNIADCKAKGRMARGSRQGSAKLSESDVLAIRQSTDKLADISARFGIGQSTASQIRTGKRWEWLK